jgi:hypothetical protein
MTTATTTTFDVSDVKQATKPLPEVSYKEAVEAQLTPGKSRSFRTIVNPKGDQILQVLSSDPHALPPIESCSRYHGRLLGRMNYHPVVAAIHQAFTDHRPLCLSPDMIWLMIIQGVAHHINAHAETLRPKFVRHQETIKIQIRRDDFVKGSPENPWSEVFTEFSMKIRDHVGPKIDLFLPAFSTTGPVERAAAEVVLLNTMQPFFEYELFTGCGIPSMTLEGTHDDWKDLSVRAQGFRELGLGLWIDVLAPILDQFTRAALGDAEPTFWRSLYKRNDQSGGPVITGWITAFFPYLKHHRTGQTTMPSRILREDERDGLEEMLYPSGKPTTGWFTGLTTTNLPSGLCSATFHWDYVNRSFDMEFLGGFVGVAQDQETLTLRPEIGWAVRETPTQA